MELDERKWKGFSAFQKSFPVGHIVSATGAGDVSIAAFLTSILGGEDPEVCIENAAAAGALCCMTYDAVSNLRPLKEIRRLIDNGWRREDINACQS